MKTYAASSQRQRPKKKTILARQYEMDVFLFIIFC